MVLENIRFWGRSFGVKCGFIMFAIILLSALPAKSATITPEGRISKAQTARQVAEQLLCAGEEQFKRGLYTHVERTLTQIQDYEEYLIFGQQKRLERLMIKTRVALAEREVVLRKIQHADILSRQGKLNEARAYLKNAEHSGFLRQKERKQIKEKLNRLNNSLKGRAGGNIANFSNKQPSSGDAELSESLKTLQPTDFSPELTEKSNIEEIIRKEKILQSYVRAVVRQAITKAQGLLNEGKFYKAQQVVETARQTMSEHRATVGEKLFGQYETRLEQLIGQITRGRARWLGSWEGRGAWKL